MSLNEIPSSQRAHIGFFGCTNAGKSSVVNSVTGQAAALVSEIKGTTTDPVKKAMEILPMGPVVIIDTPGFDDEGELGKLRVERTKSVLEIVDAAVLVVDSLKGKKTYDVSLENLFKQKKIPYITVYNKADLLSVRNKLQNNEIYVSALNGENINELKEKIARILPVKKEKGFVNEFIKKGDTVILVTPIDESAPKGRIILPQQQVLRNLLDIGALTVVVQPKELSEALKALSCKVKAVITDSQAFKEVSEIVPKDILLTSFSILMANYKGFLKDAVLATAKISTLKKGDKILIAESCTHHRQCNDIGTVKIPRWIREHINDEVEFETASGNEFPDDLRKYAAVIHCGGCMITEREVQARMEKAREQNVPFANYGTVIAHMNGILKRSLEVFPEILKLLKSEALL